MPQQPRFPQCGGPSLDRDGHVSGSVRRTPCVPRTPALIFIRLGGISGFDEGNHPDRGIELAGSYQGGEAQGQRFLNQDVFVHQVGCPTLGAGGLTRLNPDGSMRGSVARSLAPL